MQATSEFFGGAEQEGLLTSLFVNRHAPGSSYLLNSGSILTRRFSRVSLVGSEGLKKRGASSTSHLGSTAMTERMYSLVVRMSSW